MELTDVVVPIIVGVATAYAGYRFGCWKTRQDLLVGKQVGLVEEFITAAHTNLRYLPGGGAEGQGGPAAADLARLICSTHNLSATIWTPSRRTAKTAT